MNRRQFLGLLPVLAGSAMVGGPALAATTQVLSSRRNNFSAGSSSPTSTYMRFLFNGGSGENEISDGLEYGLSEANRTLTQIGTVPAASGGGRALNGTSQGFTGTATLSETIFKRTAWGVMFLISDYVNNVSNYSNLIFPVNGGVQMWVNTSGNLVAQANGSGQKITTNTVPTSGDVYIAFWCDGVNNWRMGFKATTAPTAWEDFAANDRVDSATSGDLTGVGGDTVYIGYYTGANWTQCVLKEVRFSQSGLPT